MLSGRGTGPLRVRFAAELAHFGASHRVGRPRRYADMPAINIDGTGRTLLAWVDSPASSRGTTKSRAVVAEAHGTHFTPPAVLPVAAGLVQRYLGDEPLTAAAANGKAELVTYGASHGSRDVGQLAFLRG